MDCIRRMHDFTGTNNWPKAAAYSTLSGQARVWLLSIMEINNYKAEDLSSLF
jgi:hypothetical protein